MHPERQSQARVVTAQRPTHVWHVDLTIVPTQMGFWCCWLPFAVPQCWPWCWWLGLVLDHYSRRIMGVAIFGNAPASVEIQSLLGRAIHAAGTAPKYLISDKGPQFWPTRGYAKWCRAHGIKPRFGAIGRHGSIAIIEPRLAITRAA